MTIPPPSATDPYQAAAALDRALRSPGSDAGDSPFDSVGPDSGPDVVVTLGKPPQAAATYNASGKLPSSEPTDSANDDDGAASDATSSAPAADDSSANATADNEETATA
jgi:hypothetical protein